MDLLCLLPIFLLLPLVMIVGGLLNIFKKDWMWQLLEWSQQEINPQRTARWEKNTTVRGVFFIILGIGLAIYVLVMVLPLYQTR